MIPETENRPSVAAMLEEAERRLSGRGVDSARLDAELLMAHACGRVSRARLVAGLIEPSDFEIESFRCMVERRAAREPIAYIVGWREFFSLDFEVNPAVLIPRPETETLVEAALEFLAGVPAPRVLDIGAGCGAIAVAIATSVPDAAVIATDTVKASLEVSRRNAARHRCGGRVTFLEADLFPGGAGSFDLIVSNPPYIPTGAIEDLPTEVRLYEPRLALDGGSDGLEFYRRIAPLAFQYLKPGGAVMVEVGEGQSSAVGAMFRTAGFGKTGTIEDLSGKERVMVARTV